MFPVYFLQVKLPVLKIDLFPYTLKQPFVEPPAATQSVSDLSFKDMLG